MIHIAIIGFKHVGKSTIGKQLASQLQRSFIDLDQAICDDTPYPTPHAMVQALGEPAFRMAEKNMLRYALDQASPSVISCGGGIICNEYNQQQLTNAFVVYLDDEFEQIWPRIASSHSTLFDSKEQARLHFEERRPLYEAMADAAYHAPFNLEDIKERILK